MFIFVSDLFMIYIKNVSGISFFLKMVLRIFHIKHIAGKNLISIKNDSYCVYFLKNKFYIYKNEKMCFTS